MDEQFLNKVYEKIEDNIDNEDYSVEKLAMDVGLSRSMLHRKLIKLTGKSANEVITERRLEYASSLLKDNVATVSEIAYRVGFKNPSYFNKVFKQYYNISPGDLRRSAQSENIELNLAGKRKVHWTRQYSNTIIATAIILLGLILIQYTVISPPGKSRSIAVLPLSNLTGNHANDYIIDGIHDALIGELGRISSLRVISRKSTLRYKESEMLLSDIAKDLGVANIIEGSILSVGDSIHLIIQVIKAQPNERHVMAADYHDKIDNILHIQSDVAKDAAKSVHAKVSKKELKKINDARAVNPKVYKAYLRGMHLLHQGTKDAFDSGIQQLQHAIDIDPGDPFAYAGIALGYAILGHGQLNSETSFNRAVRAANKAIKLDPTMDEPYMALSILSLYHDWNWPQAKLSFENALSINPNSAISNAHYAWYHVLFNDMEKAVYYAEKATLLEPVFPAYHTWLGLIYCKTLEFDKAEICARRALDLKADAAYGNLILGWCSLHQKQYQQAIEYHERLPKGIYWDTHLTNCYVRSGESEKALLIWLEYEEKAKNEIINPCYMGMLAAHLGKTEQAFQYLNEAVDKKMYPITYLNFYPYPDEFRDDKRFAYLLQKMNLPVLPN